MENIMFVVDGKFLHELKGAPPEGLTLELVRDLRQVVADYRGAAGRERDDDATTNVLNMWITRFGGQRR